MKKVVLSLAFAVALLGLTRPAAADVTVDLVAASQFEFPYFVAVVSAQGGTELSADLLVNDTALGAPAKVEKFEYSYLGRDITAFKIIYNASVVKPGDTVTAVVTDIDLSSATKTVACGAGIARARVTAICK